MLKKQSVKMTLACEAIKYRVITIIKSKSLDTPM